MLALFGRGPPALPPRPPPNAARTSGPFTNRKRREKTRAKGAREAPGSRPGGIALRCTSMSATSGTMDAGPIGPVQASAATARSDRLVGLALMWGAVLCFAGLDTTAKWLSHETHPLLGVWARYVSSVVLV